MYVNRRVAISKFWLGCHAVAAKVEGTIIGLLDGISAALTYGSRSNSVVHANAGCELGHPNGFCVESGSCRRGRAGRSYVIGPVGIDKPRCEPNGPWQTITVQTSGGKVSKFRKDATGDRRKGRWGLHLCTAKYSSERQTVSMAIAGLCEYPHAYFSDGTFECVGGGCGTGNWKKFVEGGKARRLDKRSTKGAI